MYPKLLAPFIPAHKTNGAQQAVETDTSLTLSYTFVMMDPGQVAVYGMRKIMKAEGIGCNALIA